MKTGTRVLRCSTPERLPPTSRTDAGPTTPSQTARQVQEDVIRRFRPELDLSTKSDDFVAGTYDGIMFELERKARPTARADSNVRLHWQKPLATSKDRPIRFDSAYVPEWLKPLASSQDR
jgi:hypothetical protein